LKSEFATDRQEKTIGRMPMPRQPSKSQHDRLEDTPFSEERRRRPTVKIPRHVVKKLHKLGRALSEVDELTREVKNVRM
jgi:hypothetical protein